jgi:multiple sugar transport system permease protein
MSVDQSVSATAVQSVQERSQTPLPDRRRGKALKARRGRTGRLLVLTVVTAALLFPVYWIIATSLKSSAQLGQGSMVWLPVPPHVENFVQAVTAIPFAAYLGNSLFLSTVTGVLTTLSSAFVGYGFARLHGPGKKVLFGVLIAMMMMPGIVTLIPTYLLFSRVGLVGTYWPWVLWGLAGAPYLIFL